MKRPLVPLVLTCMVSVGLLAGCAARDPAMESARDRGDIAGVQAAVRAAYPDVPQVSTGQLWREMSSENAPVLIDVRSTDEFAVSHLPGAVCYVPGMLERIPPDAAVVLYCSVGVRSSEVARQFIRAGRGDVRQLDGSIFRWATESRPMVDEAGQPTRLVHPFDRRWARLLPGSIRAVGW